MTEPQDPGQPWQNPGGQPSGGQPYDPYAQGQQPPPYAGAYGSGTGGLPSYPGQPGGYLDPAAGLASRWARLGAAIIDSLVMAVVTVPISLVLIDWDRVFDPQPGDPVVDGGQVVANLISMALGFLYFWLLHATRGQTVGKMVLGIRVVRMEDGGAISMGQALGRSAFYTLLGWFCFCVGILDDLWLLWDERKQCLHDKVAHTVVVKVVPGTPDPYSSR